MSGCDPGKKFWDNRSVKLSPKVSYRNALQTGCLCSVADFGQSAAIDRAPLAFIRVLSWLDFLMLKLVEFLLSRLLYRLAWLIEYK